MNAHTDDGIDLRLLRELPEEMSLEQVERFIIALPPTPPPGSWSGGSFFNLNSILMSTAGLLLVGLSIHLFTSGGTAAITPTASADRAAPTAAFEAPATVLPAQAKPQQPPRPVPTDAAATASPVEARSAVEVPVSAPAPGPSPASAPASDPAPASAPAPAPAPPPMDPVVVLAEPSKHGEGRRYDLSGFTAVQVRGSMDVVVEQGPFEVMAEGEEDALDRIEVSMEGTVLRIANSHTPSKNRNCDPAGAHVRVRMPQVSALEVYGSGGITAEAMTANGPLRLLLQGSGSLVMGSALAVASLTVDLAGSGDVLCGAMDVGGTTEVKLSGSGDVVLEGRTTKLTIDLAGSGDVDASGLDSGGTTATLVGSGDIMLGRTGPMEQRITGSGRIEVHGSLGGHAPQGEGSRSY
ncbi:MAG: DUF2807 domain-containing protein [Flavobacteriales bacterium]|nr:DUF2807 domain-containing protein [Flavobacteriales bacterium]